MKRSIPNARICFAIVAGCLGLYVLSGTTASAREDDREAIEEVIDHYYSYVNQGDHQKVLGLYTDDIVFMGPFAPSRVGKTAVAVDARSAYSKIAFNFTYEIKEVVIAGDWAFVRSNSIGTMTMKSTGQSIVDSAKALHILKRQKNGSWKIARYIFNPSTPL